LFVTFESFRDTTKEFPIIYLSGDLEVLEFILDAMISYLSFVPLVILLGTTCPYVFLFSSVNL